jgi:hypothetical protein
MITRKGNIAKFRREVSDLTEFGKAEAYRREVTARLTGQETDPEIAQILEEVSSKIWGEIQSDLRDEGEQEDIDSGWAAERAAQHRWEQSAW